jgi:metallopeptidase MepB
MPNHTEAAHLLGYPNHASYILEIRMAKSPELVKPFLADLSEKLDSAAHKELAVLQGLKEKDLQELGRVRTTANLY